MEQTSFTAQDGRAPSRKVFVITLNWNGRQWLGGCLASILAMDYPDFEVLFVDNGSTDGSVSLVQEEFPSVRVICNEGNLGYARGFNRGLEYAYEAGAEYFLIMNNDTVIDRHALSALVETAQTRHRAGFVSGKVYFYDAPDTIQTVGKEEDPVRWNGDHIGIGQKDEGQYESVEERVFMDDVFTLVSRQLYEEVGGYDPQFFLQSEEFDWQARAKSKGWRLYYTPAAKLWHRVSMSMGGLGNPTGRYFDMRSAMVVMARHAGLRRFARFYVWAGYSSFSSLIRGVLRPSWARLKPRLAMALGFLGGTLWMIHRRPATRVPFLIRLLGAK